MRPRAKRADASAAAPSPSRRSRARNGSTSTRAPTMAWWCAWTARSCWNALPVGMHSESRTVALDAGAHRLEIDHWQRAGGRTLNVQWAPAGGTPGPLSPTRLFEDDPGRTGLPSCG